MPIGERQQKDELELEQYRAFHEVYEPILDKLIGQMRSEIESNRYAAVIGDDRSGRLPAMAVHGIMANVARDYDTVPPKMFFIHHPKMPLPGPKGLDQRVEDIKNSIGENRVLVVTDYIETGSTLRKIITYLEFHKIPFDVAALSRKSLGTIIKFDEKKQMPKDSKLFLGEDNSDKGLIFWTRMRSDERMPDHIKRNDTGLVKSEHDAIAQIDSRADRALVTSARELNNEIAHKLYEKYFRNDELNKQDA